MEPARLRLENIQGLRAIAAMMVVILHVFVLAQQWHKPVMASINQVTHPLGHGGVDMFFVISGFIIVWVTQRAVGDAPPLSRASANVALTFALHRLARIYPLFWITLAAGIGVRVARGQETPWHRFAEEPGSLLLLSEPPTHVAAWTLVYEVHFYAVAALLIAVSGRYAIRALAGWAALHLVLVAALMVAGVTSHVFLSPISMELAMGTLLGAAMVLRRGHAAPLLCWCGVAILVAGATLWSGADTYPNPLRVLVWGVPAMGGLYGLIVLETKRGFRLPAWLRRWGDRSYSLYLWHLPIMFGFSATVAALGRKGTFAGGAGFVVATIGLSLLMATLSYRVIERPIMRWVQRRAPAPRAIPVAAD